MGDFEKAYKFTGEAEGGFSRRKHDKGGTTKYGITEKTFLDAKQRGLIDPSLTSVEDITPNDAKRIFHEIFWKDMRGDELPSDLSIALFDAAVNFGRPHAVRMLQKILKVKPDGIMGPGTLETIKHYRGDLVGEYLRARLQAHEDRVKKDPTQQDFIKGWRRRIENLRHYLGHAPLFPSDPAVKKDAPSRNQTGAGSNHNPSYNLLTSPPHVSPADLEKSTVSIRSGKNHSSLDAPWTTDSFAFAGAGAPGAGGAPAPENLLLSPETSRNDPAAWAHWLLQHTSENGPAGMGGPFSVQPVAFAPTNAQGYGPSPFPFSPRPGNLLVPEADPFREAYERGYASAQAEKSRSGQTLQATKPFYSLRDKINFLGKVYAQAKPISEETGLSLPFILAHAAHETGWGKNVNGNNLFNLKADGDWQGAAITKGSTTYRAYPSYEQGMKDYLEYLQSNPRYGKMFEPVTRQSLGRLVDAIHYAGYSDDPLYGPRILAAAKDPLMKRALWQFEKWPPGRQEKNSGEV